MIDHRKLGRELELFESEPLVGAGLPLWLPAGAAARYAVESYVRRVETEGGYQHVYSPPLARREMYERSGHLDHFAAEMFPPMPVGGDELILRPSLCPHHAMVFASRGRSYRDLPVRIAEFGGQYRTERSGVLSGLFRVRSISLNDGHVFCTEDQIGSEVAAVLAMIVRVHRALGIAAAGFRLSRRGPGEKYAGAGEQWDRAEQALRDVLVDAELSFVEAPGEAAFYGPKIDVQMRDCAGHEFTLATVQVDFHQPGRFDLAYVAASGERRCPIMVHRSIVGSLERLFAHLIEVHEGAFPAWYAPVQVIALPVAEVAIAAAADLVSACVAAGIRAELDADGSLSARIRAAQVRKIPYLAVIGERELAAGAVSLRARGGPPLPGQPVAAALAYLGAALAEPAE